MSLFRRTRSGGGRGGDPPGDDLVARFGHSCPVCGLGLGTAPPLHSRTGRFTVPPCFRLEVGSPEGTNQYPWRVRILGVNYLPAKSTTPAFVEEEVEYVYLLCGGGHIFPDAMPLIHPQAPGHGEAKQHIGGWNMVAAVGATASGKTYLLLRMLHQDLNNLNNLETDDDGRIRLHQLSPLEQVPLTVRAKLYQQTLATGHAIPPTNMDNQGTPAGILGEVLPDVLDVIKEMIHRTVVEGERRARSWGTRFRQPLVVRTDSRGQRTWTGVADLPGELFDPDNGLLSQQAKLRGYDALVWVLDPVVAANALDRFTKDSLDADRPYTDVLDGSLRPGSTAIADHTEVRTNRDHVQSGIGRSLTLIDGPLAADRGTSLQMLVAVTKCDLIHAALRRRGLRDLGDPGVVAWGTADYLHVLTRRWAAGEVPVEPDGPTVALLRYLHGGQAADHDVRRLRVAQIADGLLDRYSDQGAFWDLVHTGARQRLVIPSGTYLETPPWRLDVPSIDEHLDCALRRGAARRLLLRDLVMSAVGCGVAYGLGYQSALSGILQEPWQAVRFFLCSPLATVPVATDDEHLSPLEPDARFPRLDERSAALTQLLLAVLGKARS